MTDYQPTKADRELIGSFNLAIARASQGMHRNLPVTAYLHHTKETGVNANDPNAGRGGSGGHGDPTGTIATNPTPDDYDHWRILVQNAVRHLDAMATYRADRDPQRAVTRLCPECSAVIDLDRDGCLRCTTAAKKPSRLCANPACRWHANEIPADVDTRTGRNGEKVCDTCGKHWSRNGRYPQATAKKLLEFEPRAANAEGG